jgi:hypothetical protein
MNFEKKVFSSSVLKNSLLSDFCSALMVFQTYKYLKGPSGRIRVLKVTISFLVFCALMQKCIKLLRSEKPLGHTRERTFVTL